MPEITDMAWMPITPLMARLVWLARAPAKSSVLIWFAGMRASATRYPVHWLRRSVCRKW
jgi:hypothetical protein